MVKLGIGGSAVLVVATMGLWLWLKPVDPTTQIAIKTYDLLQLSRNLSTNLGETNATQATKGYLALLASMQADCQSISADSTHIVMGAPGANTVRSSTLLCGDLTRVARYSQALYTPIAPLLTSSTAAMRFETIWPFAGMIRAKHLSEIAAARKQMGHPGVELGFDSGIDSKLDSLNKVVVEDPGLTYFGALSAFQVSSLGERKTFWLSYVQLSALKQRLRGQVNSYCGELSIRLAGCN